MIDIKKLSKLITKVPQTHHNQSAASQANRIVKRIIKRAK